MADENRPYIGYRSAGRRPEAQQDRRAAADAPLSALRGMVSGVLGAPGDIESLIRMLPGLSEQTVLPTSEDIEKRLPFRELNQTPTGRAFTTAGQLGGGASTPGLAHHCGPSRRCLRPSCVLGVTSPWPLVSLP